MTPGLKVNSYDGSVAKSQVCDLGWFSSILSRLLPFHSIPKSSFQLPCPFPIRSNTSISYNEWVDLMVLVSSALSSLPQSCIRWQSCFSCRVTGLFQPHLSRKSWTDAEWESFQHIPATILRGCTNSSIKGRQCFPEG